jgi:hypothetical protein
MAKKLRAFISFDYDHDVDLKTMLVGQARHADTPFEIADWSVKEHQAGNWIRTPRRASARSYASHATRESRTSCSRAARTGGS